MSLHTHDETTRNGPVRRPYSGTSPWNTPIPPGTPERPGSRALIDRLASVGKPLTCDVDQFTIPVHVVGKDTPTVRFRPEGYWSDYRSGSRVDMAHTPTRPYVGQVDGTGGAPIPPDARGGAGGDGQLVLWDVDNDLEWGFWQFRHEGGEYRAASAYVVSTGGRASGVFEDGLAGRGAGTPYLAGTVRREEIEAGVISHALAFGYAWPSPEWVKPASKSDGRGVRGVDLPEGTRLQLNPELSHRDLAALGLSGEAVIVARALQTHGMYVVDNSGSSKVYLEDRSTAGWGPQIHRDMLTSLEWTQFRVV